MTRQPRSLDTVLLADPGLDDLAGASLGTARVLADDEDTTEDFALLDTFDGSLMGSGRMLVAAGPDMLDRY